MLFRTRNRPKDQLASLRNFMKERRGRVPPHPVGAAISTIKAQDIKIDKLRVELDKAWRATVDQELKNTRLQLVIDEFVMDRQRGTGSD